MPPPGAEYAWRRCCLVFLTVLSVERMKFATSHGAIHRSLGTKSLPVCFSFSTGTLALQEILCARWRKTVKSRCWRGFFACCNFSLALTFVCRYAQRNPYRRVAHLWPWMRRPEFASRPSAPQADSESEFRKADSVDQGCFTLRLHEEPHADNFARSMSARRYAGGLALAVALAVSSYPTVAPDCTADSSAIRGDPQEPLPWNYLC